MAYTEILTTHNLTVEQWNRSIFTTYTAQNFWGDFMGPSDMAIGHVNMDLTKKPGDQIHFGLRGTLQGGKVTGNATGVGNEGSVSFYEEGVTIDNVRFLTKAVDKPMTEQRTAFNVLRQMRGALEDKGRIDLQDEITTQLSDTAEGRVRGRYLYGAADSNWNATHATALTAVDNAADQLTTNMISVGKRKAQIPGTGVGEKMRPMMVNMGGGKKQEEWYAFVGHTYALRDMINNDAAWRNAQLNIPPQSNRTSPIFSGSRFKGAWDGVLIYEYEGINLVSSTIQCAHNFLLGAQAFLVAWGQASKFGEEEQDVGHKVIYEIHEIRGIQKAVFNTSNSEDHGTIHIFSAAVAD